MTDTAAQEAPAEAGTGELLALTDEELIVLGVTPDQIGVLPFWDSLTEDEQNMGRRTAFRGLIARGLVAALVAKTALPVVSPLKLAELFLALAKPPATLLVRFGLTRGHQVDAPAGDLDRRGRDIDHGLGQAAAQNQRAEAD